MYTEEILFRFPCFPLLLLTFSCPPQLSTVAFLQLKEEQLIKRQPYSYNKELVDPLQGRQRNLDGSWSWWGLPRRCLRCRVWRGWWGLPLSCWSGSVKWGVRFAASQAAAPSPEVGLTWQQNKLAEKTLTNSDIHHLKFVLSQKDGMISIKWGATVTRFDEWEGGPGYLGAHW